MKKTLNKIISKFHPWKVEGMEFYDNTSDNEGVFFLLYDNLKIGILTYKKGKWTFEYTNDFKDNQFIMPLLDFPAVDKKYVFNELLPFFATRIPNLNQPFHRKKIENANILDNDIVSLLKVFGKNTINNPFVLISE